MVSPCIRGGWSCPPELGGDGGGEQGGVRADSHEGPAVGLPGGRGRAVANEQPARLAVPCGRRPHPFDRCQVGSGLEVTGHPEVVAEVLGPTNSTSTPSMAAIWSTCSTADADSTWTTPRTSALARARAPGSSPNRQARL